jgi:adenosine deaminase
MQYEDWLSCLPYNSLEFQSVPVAQAELHLHIEGTLEPGHMLELADRNGVRHKIPYDSIEDVRAAYDFQNLESFLKLYYAGCAVLITKQVTTQASEPAKTACLCQPQSCISHS